MNRQNLASLRPLLRIENGKTCVACNEEKSMDEFSWKDKEKTRKDKVCKACRVSFQIQRRKEKNASLLAPETTSRKVIPISQSSLFSSNRKLHSPYNFNETEKIVAGQDFDFIENCYGRKLNHFEKTEITQNFNEFILLLRSIYGKVKGKNVFITRKKNK